MSQPPIERPFRPRARDVTVDGVPWIARMSDKAKAFAGGYIDEYIYPCPIDRRVLAQLQLSSEDFIQMSVEAESDEQLAKNVRSHVAELRKAHVA